MDINAEVIASVIDECKQHPDDLILPVKELARRYITGLSRKRDSRYIEKNYRLNANAFTNIIEKIGLAEKSPEIKKQVDKLQALLVMKTLAEPMPERD